MISIEKLKEYALKLMLEMKTEEEYETLQKELETNIKQMEIIGKIKGIDKVEPMSFPFDFKDAHLRKDEIGKVITKEEAIANAASKEKGQVRVPKVVE